MIRIVSGSDSTLPYAARRQRNLKTRREHDWDEPVLLGWVQDVRNGAEAAKRGDYSPILGRSIVET